MLHNNIADVWVLIISRNNKKLWTTLIKKIDKKYFVFHYSILQTRKIQMLDTVHKERGLTLS